MSSIKKCRTVIFASLKRIHFILIIILVACTGNEQDYLNTNPQPDQFQGIPGHIKSLSSLPINLSATTSDGYSLLIFFNAVSHNVTKMQPYIDQYLTNFETLNIIGVYCPEGAADRDPQIANHLCINSGVLIPVLHDPEYTIWNSCNIRYTPTCILINPKGEITGRYEGYEMPEKLFYQISEYNNSHRTNSGKKNIITKYTPLLNHETTHVELVMPTSIQLDSQSGTLFISDRSKNRILICDTSGLITNYIGNGEKITSCGRFSLTSLNCPENIFFDNQHNFLYISMPSDNTIIRADIRTQMTEYVTVLNKNTSTQKPMRLNQFSPPGPTCIWSDSNYLFCYSSLTNLLWKLIPDSGWAYPVLKYKLNYNYPNKAKKIQGNVSMTACTKRKKTVYWVDNNHRSYNLFFENGSSYIGEIPEGNVIGNGLVTGLYDSGKIIYSTDPLKSIIGWINPHTGISGYLSDTISGYPRYPSGITGDSKYLYVVSWEGGNIYKYNIQNGYWDIIKVHKKE